MDHDLPYVIAANGCHETTLSKSHGYGRFKRHGVVWAAHRYVWTLVNGPIPDDMVVMHTCDNPACINLNHLRLGTQADNMADKAAKGRWRGAGSYTPHHNALKTHCPHGHEYTPENTSLYYGWRYCRICLRARRHQKASEMVARR